MKRIPFVFLAVLAVGALAFSACGDDENSSAGSESEGSDSTEGADPKPAVGPFTIGLLYWASGSGGVFGPSAERALRLAVEDINAGGGVNGYEVNIETADTATDLEVGREAMRRLVSDVGADVVIGVHTSATREAARPIAEESGTLYLYGTVYEGGECSEVVISSGEVPAQQLGQAIPWMMERTGGSRWFLLGNDYVWPRKSFESARRIIEQAGGEVAGERYVPLGTRDFGDALEEIAAAGADLIFPALVGDDAIAFERQAPEFGVGQAELPRLANMYDESMLAAIGSEFTAGMILSLGYVKEVPTIDNQAFVERYVSQFGEDFPPNTFSAHVYELALLWAEAVNEIGTTDAAAVSEALKGRSIDSLRGRVTVTDSRHMTQPIFMVEVGPDGEQSIVEIFYDLDPEESCDL